MAVEIDKKLQLFAENGVQIFRNVIPAGELRSLALFIKALNGLGGMDRFVQTDVGNHYPEARHYILDDRILRCIRACIGDDILFFSRVIFK